MLVPVHCTGKSHKYKSRNNAMSRKYNWIIDDAEMELKSLIITINFAFMMDLVLTENYRNDEISLYFLFGEFFVWLVEEEFFFISSGSSIDRFKKRVLLFFSSFVRSTRSTNVEEEEEDGKKELKNRTGIIFSS